MKNEPAFPTPAGINLKNEHFVAYGLTKREYFAAMAMQGLLANSDIKTLFALTQFASEIDYSDKHLTKQAVASADALIAELEKESK